MTSARLAHAPHRSLDLAALKRRRKLADFTLMAHYSHARGEGLGASCRGARDSNPVQTTATRGLMSPLALRRASPWTATRKRDRPARCSICASRLCGAVRAMERSLVAEVDGFLMTRFRAA